MDRDFPDPPRGKWSPDGAWLALNARSQTWLFRTGDWQNHRVLYGAIDGAPAAPDWSPDSRSLTVNERLAGERLAVLGLEGNVKPLLYDQDIRPVPKLFEYCYPEWSPDSKSVAYLVLPEELVGKLPEYFELWLMDIASGAKRKLAEHVINPLVWSPDGTKIALYTKKGPKDNAVLGILDPLTATVTPIPNLPKTRWAAPKWAPDSQRLALSTEDGVFITTLEGVITPVASQAAVVLGWTSDNQYLIIGTSETISSGFQEMIKAISIE